MTSYKDSADRGEAADNSDVDDDLIMLMKAVPGVPGDDYPILSTDALNNLVKDSTFTCEGKKFGGEIRIFNI